MKTRILVAVVCLPLFLAVLLVLPEIATAVLLAAMSVVAAYEMMRASGLSAYKGLLLLSYAAAASVVFWGYFGCPQVWGAVGVIFFALVLSVLFIASRGTLPYQGIGMVLFSGLLIPWLLSALLRILMMEHGRFLVLVPLVSAFSADSGAYFVGCAIGRHKLAPEISPKKTVEGAIGGIVCAIGMMMLYGWVMSRFFDFKVQYLYAAVYGLAGAVTSILGDLMFSVIKRQVKIKDYGTLLPGHGGILDRFDSMTLVAPVTEVLLLVLPFLTRT